MCTNCDMSSNLASFRRCEFQVAKFQTEFRPRTAHSWKANGWIPREKHHAPYKKPHLNSHITVLAIRAITWRCTYLCASNVTLVPMGEMSWMRRSPRRCEKIVSFAWTCSKICTPSHSVTCSCRTTTLFAGMGLRGNRSISYLKRVLFFFFAYFCPCGAVISHLCCSGTETHRLANCTIA